MSATDILIGFGEVGSALHAVLSERRAFVVVDPAKGLSPEPGKDSQIDWMHVAFPYSESFIQDVTSVVTRWQPDNTVIHSTVKVGTTRQIEKNTDYQTRVFFSPIRGRHPQLARYLRDFSKWYATATLGEDDARFTEYFAAAGIQTRKGQNYEWLEWAKLVETFTYGYNLVLWQELERQVTNIPGNRFNNLSMLKMWLQEKKRVYDGDLGYVPIYDLVPGPIGGHCVTENWKLLADYFHPSLYRWLIDSNEMRRTDE